MLRFFTGLAVLVLLWACSSHTQPQPAAPTSPQAVQQPPAGSTSSAVRIFIDPITGEPREPTLAEQAELAKQDARLRAERNKSQQNGRAPKEIILPDGGVGIEVPPDMDESLQGCSEGKDVRIAHDCNAKSTTPQASQESRK
jgi:hypothetical protein